MRGYVVYDESSDGERLRLILSPGGTHAALRSDPVDTQALLLGNRSTVLGGPVDAWRAWQVALRAALARTSDMMARPDFDLPFGEGLRVASTWYPDGRLVLDCYGWMTTRLIIDPPHVEALATLSPADLTRPALSMATRPAFADVVSSPRPSLG